MRGGVTQRQQSVPRPMHRALAWVPLCFVACGKRAHDEWRRTRE
jgi:hypothetical protein